MSDILDDLDSPWPADYALQPKNSSERFDVIHAQEVKRQAADEIRGLREQVAALTSDRDDWIACHAKIFRELQETKTLVGNKCAEVAALAEQNAMFRKLLPHCTVGQAGYEVEQLFLACVKLLNDPTESADASQNIR